MKLTVERILTGSIATFLVFCLTVSATSADRKSKATRPEAKIKSTDTSIKSGAPDTDVDRSPSASPNLETATAPSREGAAPSYVPPDFDTERDPGVQSQSSAYQITWQVASMGGQLSNGSTYESFAVAGEDMAGQTSTSNNVMNLGFVYGLSTSGGGCACDCHADPAPVGACDGVQDVLDVVQTVNVAFRGASSIIDPNVSCPNETTDVDCSGASDVIDVVKMVNVAFRGFDPLTQFCNPCGP